MVLLIFCRNRRFQILSQKCTKKHPKIKPKTIQNEAKIDQKSKKIDSKTQDGLRWPEMRPRSAQEAPKSEKRCYRRLPRRSSQPHSAELGRGGSGGEAEVRSDRLSARRGPGALFTLRESRRGHLEASRLRGLGDSLRGIEGSAR